MKWISAAILTRVQTVLAYPLTPDPIAGVAIVVENEGGLEYELFSELFSEFVGGFSPPSSGNSLASSVVASASVSLFKSNNNAAARLAKTLADTLVAGAGFLLKSTWSNFGYCCRNTPISSKLTVRSF